MTDPRTDLDITPMDIITTSPVFVPLMTKDKFSEASGIPVGVLDGWFNKKSIPTVKIRKRRLINIVALTKIHST